MSGPYVDQYWETSDPDHPLVMINWVYEGEVEVEGTVVVYNGHKRWAMKREHLLRPAGQGPEVTIDQARAFLAAREEPCDPACKGWSIFSVDRADGYEIQQCDECMHGSGSTDEHFIALPEAQAALAKEYA